MNQGLKKLATVHRLRKEALSWDDMKTTAGEYWGKAKEEFNKRPGLYIGGGAGITAGLTAAALAPKGKKTLAGVLAGLGFGVTGYGAGGLYKNNLDLQSANGELYKNNLDLQSANGELKYRAEDAEEYVKALQETFKANLRHSVREAQAAYEQRNQKKYTNK